jgi:phosphoglycerate kinase
MSHIAFGEKKTLDDVWPVRNRRFFVRTDYECIMEHGTTQPPSPLLTTILRILMGGGKVIVGCSFGQNKNAVEMKLTPTQRQQALRSFPKHLSTEPLVALLRKVLPEGTVVDFAPDCLMAADQVKRMAASSVMVLENLRFYRAELSERADERSEMAALLEQYTDVFVNDVFATLHLKCAATVELPKRLRHGVCGTLMEQEVTYFSKVLINPPRPTTLVLGSVHVEEKLKLLESLIRKVDKVLLSSAVAIPFLRVMGVNVGKLSPRITDTTGAIIWTDTTMTIDAYVRRLVRQAERYNVRLILPEDFIAHTSLEPTRFPTITPSNRVPDNLYVVDIGPRTVQRYTAEIRDSHTVFWTGRMNSGNRSDYTNGTSAIANAIGHSNCISVVGGKNTVAAVRAAGVEDDISHMTTGSASMLRVLEGTPLAALNALSDAHPPISVDINVSVPQLLRHCALFRDCTQAQLRLLMGKAVPRSHAMGDVLVHEGDRVTSMFIVARGFLHAAPKTQQGKSIAARVIGENECIGEWAFLNHRVSGEVVHAGTDDTITYQISASSLEEAFAEMAELAPQLLRAASEPVRLQTTKLQQDAASEWRVLEQTLKSSRKPNPLSAGGLRLQVATAALTAVIFHPLTLEYSKYVQERGTCLLARFKQGVVLRVLHSIMRELVYAQAIAANLSPMWSAIVAGVVGTPLRLLSQGASMRSLDRDRLTSSALESAALSFAPAAAHSLFLFQKSVAEAHAWRKGQLVSQTREVLLAVACRLVVACACIPLVLHRENSGRTLRAAGAYVLRQLLCLVVELVAQHLAAKRAEAAKGKHAHDNGYRVGQFSSPTLATYK